jgi:hypothetical protein
VLIRDYFSNSGDTLLISLYLQSLPQPADQIYDTPQTLFVNIQNPQSKIENQKSAHGSKLFDLIFLPFLPKIKSVKISVNPWLKLFFFHIESGAQVLLTKIRKK